MAKLVYGLLTIAVVAFLVLAFVLPRQAPEVIETPEVAPPNTVAWMDLVFLSEHNYLYQDSSADWQINDVKYSINPYSTYSQHEIDVWDVNITYDGFYGEGPYTSTLNFQIFQLRDCSISSISVAECEAQGGHRESSSLTWESGEIKFTAKGDDRFTLDIRASTVFFKEQGLYTLDYRAHIHFERGTESQDFTVNDSNILLKVV